MGKGFAKQKRHARVHRDTISGICKCLLLRRRAHALFVGVLILILLQRNLIFGMFECPSAAITTRYDGAGEGSIGGMSNVGMGADG